MIPEEKILEFRQKVKAAARPLVFFDDDPDGLAAFLLIYHTNPEARGVCVKGKPNLEEKYLRKVEEYGPDLVVVLDKSSIDQAFLDPIKVEVLWLDHHPLNDAKNVTIYNPLADGSGDSRPTSYWAYKICDAPEKKKIWIAAVGTVGDWSMELADAIRQNYPELLPAEVTTPAEAFFNTKLGILVAVFSFVQKGTTTDVMKSVKTLTRITEPYEILDQTTPRGRFIYKRYHAIKQEYDSILNRIKPTKSKVLFYAYQDTKLAVSAHLSNNLLYKFPEKIIIVAREKQDEVVMSIRGVGARIDEALKHALEGVEGYGGGHENACGACVKKDDMPKFLKQFKKEISKQ